MICKTCRTCQETRPIDEFGRHPGMTDGHLHHCKGCVAARQRALYERQRAARIEAARARYEANRSSILQASRERYATDPEYRNKKLARKAPKTYRPEFAVRTKRNRAAKLAQYQHNERRVRARRYGVPEGLTLGEWTAMVGRVDGCAYCGSHDRIGIDHVVPLSRGGAHEAGNVVPCCLRCNASKFNLTLVEWLFSTRKRAVLALAHLCDAPARPVVV